MSADFQWNEYGTFSTELKYSKLANLCVDKIGVQTGPFGSQLHKKDYVDAGTPIITVEHLGDNRISHANTPFVSDEDKIRLSKYHLKEGDIVFSRVGSVDRRALVRQEENGWLFSGRCLRVRADKTKIDPVYLSYFLGLGAFKQYLRSIAVGATMPSINTKILSDVPIYYPEDLEYQRHIANIFSTIDEKIENNTQTNQTLEQIAQAIFKSWFVDFEPVKAKMGVLEAGGTAEQAELAAMSVISGKDETALKQLQTNQSEDYAELAQTAVLFPSAREDSELGEIPEGWEVTKTEQLADKIAMGPFGSNIKVSTFVDSGVPIISGHHLKEPLLTEGNHNFITEDHAEKLKNSCVTRGDIVFTHAGNIGQVSLIPESTIYDKYVISQRQFYLRTNRKKASPYFLIFFFRSNYGQHILLSNASQVGVPSIARPSSHLKNIELIKPSFELMEKFELTCKSLLNGVVANRTESQELSELRDALLPKLLSGDLPIASTEVA